MKRHLREHILSMIFVTIALAMFYFLLPSEAGEEPQLKTKELETYLNLPFVDFNRPFDKALLKDVLKIYKPDATEQVDSLISAIETYRRQKFNRNLQTAFYRESLTWKKFGVLSGMYLKFIIVYIFVLALTYYGVQTLGVLRFVRKMNYQPPYTGQFFRYLMNNRPSRKQWKAWLNYLKNAAFIFAKAVVKGLGYLILFAPAYVIAYSIKTDFDTDSTFFLILLAVISNGLLITYTNKFFTFLISESRKGYVQTARVKNLRQNYQLDHPDGIALRSVFRFKKQFGDHVFQHIFMNARNQYLGTIKEQASFLISGLIIIEMALNIHGHLSYEMLQQILYKNYDIVIVIILGLFYLVKLTEIFTDALIFQQAKKFKNE